MSGTRTEQVVAEPVTESQNALLRDQEVMPEAATANIEVHPDSALAATTTDLSIYARIAAGVVASLALLSPLMLLPGFIVLVLPAEIYVVGWVYDRIRELGGTETKTSGDSSSSGTVSLETAKEKATLSSLRYTNSLFDPME
ncbi:MAG: hypothetical protein ACXADC_13255 [Candidatus Thorarchaeota archaeon]